jgi:hypothetical protein
MQPDNDTGTTKPVMIAVLFSCCVVMSSTQRLDSARPAIDAYRLAIRSAQKDASRGQLEAAFHAIEPLRSALVMSRDGGRSTLELLSEQEFTALRRDLVGLIINREEVVFVEPDVAFFTKLAAHGDAADRAFFAALSSTYPDSVWPLYTEAQTDYSGCTRFGSGTVVSTYFTWIAVTRQYPKRYAEAVNRHLLDVINALTESTCACGDRASVEREFTEFLRHREGSDVRTRVAQRLAALRSGRAPFRFLCVSG